MANPISEPFRRASWALTCAMILTVSCADRFQLVQDKAGRTLRVDRRTGEMAVVDGDRLVRIAPPPSAEELRRLEKPTTWGPWEHNDGKSISIKTAWRDDGLRYEVSLQPLSAEELAEVLRLVKSGVGRLGLVGDLTVSLFDQEGFKLCAFEVWLSGLARDSNNVASTAGQADGCTIDQYIHAKQMRLRPR